MNQRTRPFPAETAAPPCAPRSRRHARPRARHNARLELPALARLVRGGDGGCGEAGKALSPGEQPRETSAAARAAIVVGSRAHRGTSARRPNAAPVRGNARTDEDRIRLLDHAGARAHATTAESPVSVVSDIARNLWLRPAAPSDCGGAGCPKE